MIFLGPLRGEVGTVLTAYTLLPKVLLVEWLSDSKADIDAVGP